MEPMGGLNQSTYGDHVENGKRLMTKVIIKPYDANNVTSQINQF